jgi:hypothetical protein
MKTNKTLHIRRRTLRYAATILTAGVLCNHTSCNTIVREAVADGVSQFIADATRDALTIWLRPLSALLEFQSNTGGGGGSGDGDPFEPPPSQP